MMRGLLMRTLRETGLSIAVIAVALLLVERLLMFVLPQIQQQIGIVLDTLPIVRPMLSALLGMQVGDGLTAQMLQSILWVHPVVLALIWGNAIALCTRFPAGEIDRGTIDVLLGLPVTRRGAYLCESLICLVSGILIIAIGSMGYFIGAGRLSAADRPPFSAVALVQVNFLCVYIAVSGMGFLISALSDRRGRAIVVILAMVLSSFLLNFLAQFLPLAQSLSFLSVLHYYQPGRILSGGGLVWTDIATLLAAGACAWIAGGEIVARRSITTV
jgi:ABC-type transport system involved in multi-copper enzyme maturation permease subunit